MTPQMTYQTDVVVVFFNVCIMVRMCLNSQLYTHACPGLSVHISVCCNSSIKQGLCICIEPLAIDQVIPTETSTALIYYFKNSG